MLDYALAPTNERGKHKARLFQSVLGFNLTNWRTLKQTLLDRLPHHDATFTSKTIFGTKYAVKLLITGPNGRQADVLTIWQFDRQLDGTLNDRPRLVTVYVL